MACSPCYRVSGLASRSSRRPRKDTPAFRSCQLPLPPWPLVLQGRRSRQTVHVFGQKPSSCAQPAQMGGMAQLQLLQPRMLPSHRLRPASWRPRRSASLRPANQCCCCKLTAAGGWQRREQHTWPRRRCQRASTLPSQAAPQQETRGHPLQPSDGSQSLELLGLRWRPTLGSSSNWGMGSTRTAPLGVTA